MGYSETNKPCRIEMMGTFCLKIGAFELHHFQTQKTALLTSILSYPPVRVHLREQLVDTLWPDVSLSVGLNRLSQALAWLRSQTEKRFDFNDKFLISDRQFVGFNDSLISSDVEDFELAAQTAMNKKNGLYSIENIQIAEQLYKGELLAGYYEDWILRERDRLLTVYLTLLHHLIQYSNQVSDYDKAVEYARKAVVVDPLEEQHYVDLIKLHIEHKQELNAKRCFHDLEEMLKEKLDQVPAMSYEEIVLEVKTSSHSSSIYIPSDYGRNKPISTFPNPLTKLVGRGEEIESVINLIQLGKSRLITLTGVGGVGKTRLAIEIMKRCMTQSIADCCFVSLVDISHASMLLTAISDVLQLSSSNPDEMIEQILTRFNSSSSLLLILDGLEHMLPTSSATLLMFVERIPNLTILTTSRQLIGLTAEQEVPVLPLSVPNLLNVNHPSQDSRNRANEIESVLLFLDRAKLVRPEFELTPQNEDAICKIAARLDGLPLAIELCAAWAQTLTPDQMLLQLNNRFQLLVSRRSDIPSRHRTLQATLEYSFLLLPQHLQDMFVSLSIFRGGWTLDAVTTVCSEQITQNGSIQMLEWITELRERSLIIAEARSQGEMRYRMLDSVREFAEQQCTISRSTVLTLRHLHYYLELAERAEPLLYGPDQSEWLAHLEAEHENMRAALQRSTQKRSFEPIPNEYPLRLATALTPYWEVRGHISESYRWLKELLAIQKLVTMNDVQKNIYARGLNAFATTARASGEFVLAEKTISEAITVWTEIGDQTGLALAMLIGATLAWFREEYDTAQNFLIKTLVIAEQTNNELLKANTLLNLGNVTLSLHKWEEAISLFQTSIGILRSRGNAKAVGDALNNLGLAARYEGNLDKALYYLQEAIPVFTELADRAGLAITMVNIGMVHLLAGQLDLCEAALKESINLAIQVGQKRVVAWCIKEFGHLECRKGNYAAGVRLLSFSETLRHSLNISFHPADPDMLTMEVQDVKIKMNPNSFEICWLQGGEFTINSALQELNLPVLSN